jgi:hypothetical protein
MGHEEFLPCAGRFAAREDYRDARSRDGLQPCELAVERMEVLWHDLQSVRGEKMARQIFIGGDVGESVFTEVFMEWAQKNELPAFLQRIERGGDERSFVLLSALTVEAYLDELMNCLAPKFSKLAENRDFTFSLKIQILRALALIPPHILDAADIVRRVRNEFAHDLNLDILDGLKRELQTKIQHIVTETFGPEFERSKGREGFRSVTFIALAGLNGYRPNLKKLREKLSNTGMITEWKNECHQEFMRTMKAVGSEEPIETKIENGVRYRLYRDGLVRIDTPAGQEVSATIPINLEMFSGLSKTKKRE